MNISEKTFNCLQFAGDEFTTREARLAAWIKLTQTHGRRAVERKIEELRRRDYVDFGDLMIYAWLTDKGVKVLREAEAEAVNAAGKNTIDQGAIRAQDIARAVVEWVEKLRTNTTGSGAEQATKVDRGDWILTFMGKQFHPFDPQPEDICIEDIAHALSNMCRFTGHVRKFYSVAEHSVMVSKVVRECCRRCIHQDAVRLSLWGLLHDASEAYICDLARPVKRMPQLQPYRDAEAAVQTAIVSRFKLPTKQPDLVDLVDKAMLAIETRDLMPVHSCWRKWHENVAAVNTEAGFNVMDFSLKDPLSPADAENLFLNRYRMLTNELASYWATQPKPQPSTRDPRIDPRPGDKLDELGVLYLVLPPSWPLSANEVVMYQVGDGPGCRFWLPIEDWQKMMRDARVLWVNS